MFVMATVSTSSASGPVKVRNLSPSGALIEGGVLPAAKERVRLRRGALTATGQVVWCRSGRAGICFESRVKVEDWLPTGANRAAQDRVDELFQDLRAGAAERGLSSTSEAADPYTISGQELMALATAIEALADDLAGDQDVVGRHMSKLQTLDIAAQVLRKLSALSA